MPLGNYQYTSNAGTVYQATLPTDFANALGLTPAGGGLPYLDASISPRVFNYRNSIAGGRTAVVGDTTLFGAPPATLTVGGILYHFVSAIGESTPPFLPAQTFSGVIIQGAPGANGSPGAPGLGFASDSYTYIVGSVAGQLLWCQSLQGATLKSFTMLLLGFEDAGQTITFPTTFNGLPEQVVNDTGLPLFARNNTIIITPAIGSPTSGTIIFLGG